MIYFDNASTSFPKPPEVRAAVEDALATVTSYARGVGKGSEAAEDLVYGMRTGAARFFGAGGPEEVILTHNATHALNIVIRGVLGRGGTAPHAGRMRKMALVSGYEHNAVMRPLFALRKSVGTGIVMARSPLFDDGAFLEAWRQGLSLRPALAVLTAVSNVYGWILPWQEAAAMAERAGVPFLLDASQAAGHVPVRFGRGIRFLAAPGHKGLLGPAGTGLLLTDGGIALPPLIQGGTGHDSASRLMPPYPPERHEAGTVNLPGAAGLLAGIGKVEEAGVERIAAHEAGLLALCREGFRELGRARTFFAPPGARQSGLFSFLFPGETPEETAAYLASEGFAVRAGLHCAPDAHQSAGNPEGSVRVSFSLWNTEDEVRAFLSSLERKSGEKPAPRRVSSQKVIYKKGETVVQ